jgi:hypothetical protein
MVLIGKLLCLVEEVVDIKYNPIQFFLLYTLTIFDEQVLELHMIAESLQTTY